jgi:hypothetical protein
VFLKNVAATFGIASCSKKNGFEKYYTLALVVFSPVGRKLFHGIQHGTSILVPDLVALLCVLY